MNAEIKAAWLAALRSGEYRQGRNRLRSEACYCCLGVLCDLASRSGIGYWSGGAYIVDRYSSSVQLPDQVALWAGLDNATDPIILDIELSCWNDGKAEAERPHTFAEIADLIERYL